MKERRIGELICDICGVNSAGEIKGGIYNDERGIWIVCKKCKEKIKNTRKGRINENHKNNNIG